MRKLPCEVAIRSIIPSVRSLLANQLVFTCGMKTEDTADLLGITQSAVSKYTHHLRGTAVQSEIETLFGSTVKEFALLMANGKVDRLESLERICHLCSLIRSKGIMCEICARHSHDNDSGTCQLCFEQSSITE